MKPTNLRFAFVCWILCAPALWAENAKPDFSGTWVLDKEKSDLTNPPVSNRRRMRGRSGMGSGRGWPGMGGPRMGGIGGPGMGGPGMGSPPPGGSDTGSPPPGNGNRHSLGMGPVAEKLIIEHAEPEITVKRNFKIDDEQQIQELKYTTDGKSNKNTLPDGRSIKSKTHWDGSRLITKSNLDTSVGTMEIIEARNLSADGNSLTIELTTKGGSMDWTRKLVYTKEAGDSKTDENNK